MVVSEVARIKGEIETAYFSGRLGLSGLASGVSRHAVMTTKTERIGHLHEELQTIVGVDQAMQVVAETLAHLPETPTQHTVLTLLRGELGTTEETEQLLERLEDLWETRAMLLAHFGQEITRKIIETPSVWPPCQVIERNLMDVTSL